jgi:hypothetical protein
MAFSLGEAPCDTAGSSPDRAAVVSEARIEIRENRSAGGRRNEEKEKRTNP